MEYVVIFAMLFGGTGALLIGMNMMSDSMSRLAHGKLKNMLNKTANKRIAGVGIGAAVTAIIQSSAATTVMVVGLVNAGIMTLFQATAIIMGANIGTTMTAWIASFSALDITWIFFLCTVIGVFMSMLSKREIVKILGNILAGLGLIFIGLEFMSIAIKDPLIEQPIRDVLQVVNNPFLLLLLGAVITALIQSSSAVTSIIIAFATAGIFIGGAGTDGTYYVIIGSNIGTCVTALISSIGASVNARRASLIHLLFNCFGAIIFTTFLLLWSISGTSFSSVVLEPLFPGYPVFQIAMFHTLFNVVCTILFLPFIRGFVWLAEHLVRDKKKNGQDESLVVLDDRLLLQPSLALNHLYQGTVKVFDFAMDNLDVAFKAFLNKDVSAKEKVVKNNEELTQYSKDMVAYLVKISASSTNMEEEQTISNLHYVLNDIVRVGEIADNVTKYTNHYVNDNLVFSGEFLTMIQAMYEKLGKLQELSSEIYLNRDYLRMPELDALEDEIDQDRRDLVHAHIERLNEGKCQPQNSSTFINLVENLERAADHITFIAHSIEGGDKAKAGA